MNDLQAIVEIAAPGLVLLLLAATLLNVGDARVRRWAATVRVQLTGENQAAIRGYLLRSRRFRVTGAAAGYSVATSYAVLTGGRVSGLQLPLLLVGYLLGALVSEATRHSQPASRFRSAMLSPRALSDYLPPSLLILQRGVGVAAIAVALIYAMWPHGLSAALIPIQLRSFTNIGTWLPSSLGLMVFGLGGLFLMGCVEALQRKVVRLPASTMSDSQLEFAMCSSAIRILSGAGIALLLDLVGLEVLVCAAALTPGVPPLLSDLLVFLGAALWVSSIGVWIQLGEGYRLRGREEVRA